MANTYLCLPPEMGGTQFGPFTGIVQIGSDPGQCQIVLNAAHGIAPVHVTVTEQPNGTYAVSPAARGFGLFIARGGGMSVQPAPGAIVANPGDVIILGQPGGPRFQIRREDGKKGVAGAVGPPGHQRQQRGMGDAITREAMRQGQARLLTKNPLFRDLYHGYYRYRTGALSNPRVLVGLVSAVAALLFAGVASCGGLLAGLQSGIFGNN